MVRGSFFGRFNYKYGVPVRWKKREFSDGEFWRVSRMARGKVYKKAVMVRSIGTGVD